MSKQWDIIIQPKRSVFEINLKQLYKYKDLLFLFVKRDVVTIYKQTILGPIWFFVQPILTMVIYVFVFGNIANISTDGIPQPLFYLAGIVMWNYFAESFNQTADTFTQNANLFGKVFFPRLIVPLSKVISALIKFVIQFLLFLALYLYFLFNTTVIQPSYLIILLPVLLLLMAGLGLGFGLIFSSLTTKYKDLKFLIQFGVQLLMYATPIIYPLSTIPVKYQFWIKLNPITHIIETFKTIFLGSGQFSGNGLLYACVFTLFILTLGVLIFNKTEQKFMDTV
ncbi:MAG TPA: ABC transporter permease [Vicingaceae bacterium]|nr:ABC transporter permease [Vicingaceae bacterium]